MGRCIASVFFAVAWLLASAVPHAQDGSSDTNITARITGVELVSADDRDYLHILGTIDAPGFKRAWMQIGQGSTPTTWRFVGQKRKYPIEDGVLGKIPLSEFSGGDLWLVVINVEDTSGLTKQARFPVRIN